MTKKQNIYYGDSLSFESLVEGFIDYSKEVALNRNFPSLFDGLKPVQRRILYASLLKTSKGIIKSAENVGNTIKLHPHGESSIYGAYCRMVDTNGSTNFKFYNGLSNFGHVTSSTDGASMRYTEASLSEDSKFIFLEDMEGVFWKDQESADDVEPVDLPTKFPAALMINVQGIGVGFANKVPSFNFSDILDLTIKYVKTKDIYGELIYPDLANGGILVQDNKEIAKIMLNGRGSLVSRAKVIINKNEIIVVEPPYNKTDGSIEYVIKKLVKLSKKKKLDNGETNPNFGCFPYVSSTNEVTNESDTRGCRVVIQCKNKSMVEQCLLDLYRRNILQTKFTSNMIFTKGTDKLKACGVYGVIENWYEWRKEIITRTYNARIEKYSEELTRLDYFMKLINLKEEKDKYLNVLSQVGSSEAYNYLIEIFPEITEDAAQWVSNRRANAFLDGGKQAKRYNELSEYVGKMQDALANLDDHIISQLVYLKENFGQDYPRKTEISPIDYKFTKFSDLPEEEDNSAASFIFFKDNTVAKVYSPDSYKGRNDVNHIVSGSAEDVLVGFDNYGRLIRIYGKDLKFNKVVSLPHYLGIGGGNFVVVYVTLLDGSKHYVLYRDGRVTLFDTAKLETNRRRVFQQRGIPEDYSKTVMDVVPFDENNPYLALFSQYKKNYQIGYVDLRTLPEKSYGAYIRAIAVKDKVLQYALTNREELHSSLGIISNIANKKMVNLDETTLNQLVESSLGDKFEEGMFNA